MYPQNEIVHQDEIAVLGASLRAIEQKLLKQSENTGIKRLWFQGEEPYFDVFFELKNDEILWFQLTLRGKAVSWDNKKSKLQTGTTNELHDNDVSFYAASKTIENDIKTDWEFIHLVKSILQTRSDETIFAKALELFK
ncbi:hypothetical protein H6G41_02215 [Tolypothrix sp. FACHB-123]|uniref:hypothetical protein n=1 Tax=Tolypothrix sp. FACHB-123 TaxID=2692868 RepID=UPI001681F753|nr:hypothetical protein [Tolypothrix sp. FACHB-123]MBD2353447.1 hypothetical protein [Tolypothrix sp. FACHB-123]